MKKQKNINQSKRKNRRTLVNLKQSNLPFIGPITSY